MKDDKMKGDRTKGEYRSNITCSICGQKNHMAYECQENVVARKFNRRGDFQEKENLGNEWKSDRPPRWGAGGDDKRKKGNCFVCGEVGHIAKNCPNG